MDYQGAVSEADNCHARGKRDSKIAQRLLGHPEVRLQSDEAFASSKGSVAALVKRDSKASLLRFMSYFIIASRSILITLKLA